MNFKFERTLRWAAVVLMGVSLFIHSTLLTVIGPCLFFFAYASSLTRIERALEASTEEDNENE